MSVLRNCRFVFRSGILAWLLLAFTSNAAAVEIIFASDFQNSQPIQWVRHHPGAGGATIALGPAYLTATRLTTGGTNRVLYLEVPPDRNANADYPLWSALKTIGLAANGIVPVIGDCLRVEGKISLFNGATQLEAAVWTAAPGECGETGITPYVAASVSSVATDADPGTPDNQPGASAEPLESVLVRLNSLTVLTSSGANIGFTIGDLISGPGVYLSVERFIYQYTAVQGSVIASITGVLDEFDISHTPDPPTRVYQLLPRSAGDVVN